MGFEVMGSAVTLEFAEGTLLHGATVKCSMDAGLSDYLELTTRLSEINADDKTGLADAYRFFGDIALRDWDLLKNGEPVPPTGDGLLSLPFAVIQAITTAWGDAVRGESPNSASASPNGKQSVQALLEATEV